MIYTSILEVYVSRKKNGLIKNPYPAITSNKIILNIIKGQSSLTKILVDENLRVEIKDKV
jgi:hypothetical protein